MKSTVNDLDSRGLGEEYGPIGEDWGHDRAEMGLRRREQEGGEWR